MWLQPSLPTLCWISFALSQIRKESIYPSVVSSYKHLRTKHHPVSLGENIVKSYLWKKFDSIQQHEMILKDHPEQLQELSKWKRNIFSFHILIWTYNRFVFKLFISVMLYIFNICRSLIRQYMIICSSHIFHQTPLYTAFWLKRYPKTWSAVRLFSFDMLYLN